MPQMGVSVSEGTITKWSKQVGEPIEADETLLEISTDKVDTEVPSPGERRRDARSSCRRARRSTVGTMLARIGGEGAAAAARRGAGSRARAAPRARAGRRELHRSLQPAEPRRRTAAAPVENGKSFVSPVVARIASEHGIDPARVPGTGTGGRVTKKDIQAFIEAGAAATPRPPAPAPQPRRRRRLPPAARRQLAAAERRSRR